MNIKIKISDILDNQIPEYLLLESPKFLEFLKQYYISQEYPGSSVDIVDNFEEYSKLDNLIPEVFSNTTTLSENISNTEQEISVVSTLGYPDRYGLLKIDDEIITYTQKTPTSFVGCVRGFSAITNFHHKLNPSELIFSTSESSEHQQGSSVENLSSLFLKEIFRKIKSYLLPGLEEVELYPGINVSNFIKSIKQFYQSKGTDESYRILFKVLYGEKVDVVDLEKFLLKSSYAKFIRREVAIAKAISGNPKNIIGQKLFKSNDDETYAYISESEIVLVGLEPFYKISLFKGYTNESYIFGNFNISPKTKVTEKTPIGSSIISVDSTVGFEPSGVIISGNNTIEYTDKSLNQFLNCTNITEEISQADDIYADEFYIAYEYGDTSKEVKLRLTGVISGFGNINEITSLKVGDIISVRSIGEKIYRSSTQKSIFANSWIYNTSTRHQISNINGATFTLFSEIDKSSLKINDEVEILIRGTSTVVSSPVSIAYISSITFGSNEITLQNLSDLNGDSFEPSNPGREYFGEYFDIRRKYKNASSTNVPIEFGNKKLHSNILNVYNEDNEYFYVASNGLPSYNITKSVIKSTLPDSNLSFFTDFDVESQRYKSIVLNNHSFKTGQEVLYLAENSPLLSLESGKTYYVYVVNGNIIRLYESRSFIGSSNVIKVSSVIEGQVDGTHTFILNSQKTSLIGRQNIFRKFPYKNDYLEKITNRKEIKGVRSLGLLVNGVEILNPSIGNKVYYGPINSIDILNSGNEYDVINLPNIKLSNPTVSSGTTAIIRPVVSGSIQKIHVDPQDFDINEIISANITGGNGTGAEIEAIEKFRFRETAFDGRIIDEGGGVDVVNETITFIENHNFIDGQKIIYNSVGNDIGIGIYKGSNLDQVRTLVDGSAYYVDVVNPKTIILYESLSDYNSGINTIGFTTSNLTGIHRFRTESNKSVGEIRIINGGSGYTNRQLKFNPSDISLEDDIIYYKKHGFTDGDLIHYVFETSAISGLSTSNEYYILKINDDSFQLADGGVIGSDNNSNYIRRNYVDLSSAGSGAQYIKYPDITVTVNVSYSSTLSTGTVVATPVVRGQIIDAYLYEAGTGYGSTVLNLNKEPFLTIEQGRDGQLTPIVVDGKIVRVELAFEGSQYYSVPDLVVNGDGDGAQLRAIVENNVLKGAVVLEGGTNYTSETTSIDVISPGAAAVFDVSVRELSVNNEFINGSEYLISSNKGDNLQYGLLGYPYSDIIKEEFNDDGFSHSPIIGWAYDGNPIYGPFGYSDPQDSQSEIKLIDTSYQSNISNINDRPDVSIYPLGFFLEDYKFNESGDLDIYNGRWTRTPEFPNGIYAYFTTLIQDEDTLQYSPVYPYFIGKYYRNEYISDNASLDQSFDINSSSLVRNTFPYKVSETYADNDFIVESNEITSQTVKVGNISVGSVDSYEIIYPGQNYSVGDSLVIESENVKGSGFSASVKSISGVAVTTISNTLETLSNFVLVKNDNSQLLAYNESEHLFNTGDQISLSGISTLVPGLNSNFEIEVDNYEYRLVSEIIPSGSNIIDIYLSKIDDGIRPKTLLVVGDEELQVLNVFKSKKVVRVLRQNNALSHEISSIVTVKPSTFRFNYKIDKFDSKLDEFVYFNPQVSVGVGTTSGTYTSVTYPIGEEIITYNKYTQSILLPNHPFKTGQKLTFRRPSAFDGTIAVSRDPESLVFNLHDAFEVDTDVYVINKTSDHVGIVTQLIDIETSEGLYLQSSGSASYQYYLKTNNNQITATANRNVTTVSVSTYHQLQNNDFVQINVKPNLTAGIGSSESIRVFYQSEIDNITIDPSYFSDSEVDINEDTITINQRNFYLGDKIVYINNSGGNIGGLVSGSTYYVYPTTDNKIKLGKTKNDVDADIPILIDFTSAPLGSQHYIALVNPELKIVNNNNIKFDLTDPSLNGYKFKLYTDDTLFNEFKSIPTVEGDETFSIIGVGTAGISTDASLILTYSDILPRSLYYSLFKDGEVLALDSDIINAGKISYVESVYTNNYKVFGITSSSFNISLYEIPERISYGSTECDILEYTTTSATAVGGISSVSITSKGYGYEEIPNIISINSNNGSDASLVLKSKNIGKPEQLILSNQGYEYSIDNSLRPNVIPPSILNISGNLEVSSVEVLSGGNNLLSPPILKLYDPVSKRVIDNGVLDPIMIESGTSIFSVDVPIIPKGLDNVEHEIYTVQNSNGVQITNVSYIASNIIEFEVQTPILGFTDPPFKSGDKVFIDGVEKYGEDGSGFNSEDYEFEFFEVANYFDSNPGIVRIDYSNYTTNTGIAVTSSFTNKRIIKQEDCPTFKVNLKYSDFRSGESILVKENNSDNYFEVDLKVNRQKTDVLTLVGTYDLLSKSNIIKGKLSGSIATVESISYKSEYLEVSYSTPSELGWEDYTGKLNNDLQVTPDNNYYQNLSYTIKKTSKQFDEVQEYISPLLHASGLKNFVDTEILEKSEFGENIGQTVDQFLIDLTSERRSDEINSIALAVDQDTNQIPKYSRFVNLLNKKIANYINCETNIALKIDDISPLFRNQIAENYVPVANISEYYNNFSTFLVEVKNIETGHVELLEIVTTTNNDNIFTFEKSQVSTNNQPLSDIIGTKEGDLQYLKLEAPDPLYDNLNIKVIRSNFYGNTIDSSNYDIGFVELNSTVAVSTVGVANTVGLGSFPISDYNAFYVNAHVLNVDTFESNFVDLYIGHDGTDVYSSEYFFDSKDGSISAEFIGTFRSYINSGILYIEHENDDESHTNVLIRSKIVGFANTSNGIGTYYFLEDDQPEYTAVSARMESDYIVSSGITTIISYTVDEISSAKSLVRVSVGNTFALHQLSIVTKLDSTVGNIVQYPILTSANLFDEPIGIGSFGLNVNQSTLETNVNFYPDPDYISDEITIEHFDTKMYAINDQFNVPNQLTYGNYSEAFSLGFFDGLLGGRFIRTSFQIRNNNKPLFVRSIVPYSPFNLDPETGIFNYKNHLFFTGEELTYEENATFNGLPIAPMGIGQTLNYLGVSTNIMPPVVYAIRLDDDRFKIATRTEYAEAGIGVTITDFGQGNSHQFIRTKSLTKSLIAIDGVVQAPITWSPVEHQLVYNSGGSISAGTSYISLSGISSVSADSILKINDEYTRVNLVGFATDIVGPITGIGTYNLVRVERGFVGTSATDHSDGSTARVYKGAFNIIKDEIYFVNAPKGYPDDPTDLTNIEAERSNFTGRVFLRQDYTTNVLYDDITDQFTGIGSEATLTVLGVNTVGIDTGNNILFLNDIFQTPTTENNEGNVYSLTETGVETKVVFTGITSSNGDLIVSDSDINANQLPRNGIIISLGSTQGLGYAPLVGASVTAIVSAGTIVDIVGLPTTTDPENNQNSFGSGYFGSVSIAVTETGHEGTEATIQAIVGAGGSLSFNITNPGTGYTNPSIIIPPPSYSNLEITGIYREGIGLTPETGFGLLLDVEVGANPNSAVSGRFLDGANLIEENIEFIADIAVGRMQAQYPLWVSPTGDPQDCTDDIVAVLNTIVYNMRFGGNDKVYDAAVIYQNGPYVVSEREETIYAFHEARDMAIQAMRNETITTGGYTTRTQYFDYSVIGDQSGLPGDYQAGDCADVASAISVYVGIVTFGVNGGPIPTSRTVAPGSLSSVNNFSISRPGYGFKRGDVITAVGLVTDAQLSQPVEEFSLTVLDIFTDSFSSWQFGELDFIDSFGDLQDGFRYRFPLNYKGELLSFETDNPSIELKSSLIIFIDGVLQDPDTSYIYDGGTSISFTEPPKPENKVNVFFYRGSRDLDSSLVDVEETIKIGDSIQLNKNNAFIDSLNQDIRTVVNIETSDKLETGVYGGLGIDENINKPKTLTWTKQKRDFVINDVLVTKARDSIEPRILPTARIISDVSTTDNEVFVDDAQFFNWEENEGYTTITEFDAIIVPNSDIEYVAAGFSATIDTNTTAVNGLTITNVGAGYTPNSSINLIVASPGYDAIVSGGSTAIAQGIVGNDGSIIAQNVSFAGLGYTTPPIVMAPFPSFTHETITGIDLVQGFSGIVTGITTVPGIGTDLAIKFGLKSLTSSDFINLLVGYPIYIFDTKFGPADGVVSIFNNDNEIVGIGTTNVDNVYNIAAYEVGSPLGSTAEIIVNVASDSDIIGIAETASNANPIGRFSWGRLSGIDARLSPISIGVTGNTTNSGLSTWPIIQRQTYGFKNSGAVYPVI